MTTYTTIPDTDVDQDSPVTQPLMAALRDNPLAIAEGTSGAPKVAGRALQQLADLPTLVVSASSAYELLEGMVNVVPQNYPVGGGYSRISDQTVQKVSGSIRLSATFVSTSGYIRLLKNGSQIYSAYSSGNVVNAVVDSATVVGDVFSWEQYNGSASVNRPTASDTYYASQAYSSYLGDK